MIISFLYIILALLGISFLIFIHELGHYFMAKRCGIKVEVFSIGFGKPIYQWKKGEEVWKICVLPFGGYVKMAGQEDKGSIQAHQIPNGFFGAGPWKQIKVAFMGPLVNILFTVVAFSLLWAMGGREKDFTDYTHYLGYVEKDSGLFETGVRPGDEVTSINGKSFGGLNEILYTAMLDSSPLHITGEKIDYFQKTRHPFSYTFGEKKQTGEKKTQLASRAFLPAGQLIYDRMPNGKINPLPKGSPLQGSGIQYGDRIMWVNGRLVFSRTDLVQNLNAPRVLLTVKRGGQVFLTRVPRLEARDIQFSGAQKEELDDWRAEAGLSETKDKLYTIPYNLNARCVVEHPVSYVNQEAKLIPTFEQAARLYSDVPLKQGDQILAVWGLPVENSYHLLKELQTPRALIIVKEQKEKKLPSFKEADAAFAASFDINGIEKITGTIGTKNPLRQTGNLRLLNPVIPTAAKDFVQSSENKEAWDQALLEKEKAIQKIKDPKARERATEELERYKNRLLLGALFQDQQVRYNPGPFTLFGDIFSQMYRTLAAVFTGYLSPKYMAGPVGIIHQIQYSWTVGAKEALYWLGLVSLNLGILNLLPIPMLDGGHIMLAIYEKITKKPLSIKTRERLILPFVILLIGFFIFVTYHDIVRLIKGLF